MNCSDIYISGRLLNDTELLLFNSKEDKYKALQLLHQAGLTVISGQEKAIILNEFSKVRTYISKYENKDLAIGLKVERARRNTKQLRFYFGVVVKSIQEFLLNNTGNEYTKQQIHIDNLVNIYGWKPVIETVNGREIINMDSAPSTGKMDTKEFSNFIEKIRIFYMEQGLEFPEYNEDSNNTINYYI